MTASRIQTSVAGRIFNSTISMRLTLCLQQAWVPPTADIQNVALPGKVRSECQCVTEAIGDYRTLLDSDPELLLLASITR